MYEHFDHTADLGIRARAPDLSGLFADAARGLFAAIVEDLDTIEPRVEQTFEIAGEDRDYLLFDWLNALLQSFEGEQMLWASFTVTLEEKGLRGVAHGEPYEPDRHQLSHEVKAITYHELRVEQVDGEWLAEVIVDI